MLPRCKFASHSVACLGAGELQCLLPRGRAAAAAAHTGQYSLLLLVCCGWGGGGERTRPCRNFLLNNIKVLVARRKLHPHCQGGAPAAKQLSLFRRASSKRDARKRFYCMRPHRFHSRSICNDLRSNFICPTLVFPSASRLVSWERKQPKLCSLLYVGFLCFCRLPRDVREMQQPVCALLQFFLRAPRRGGRCTHAYVHSRWETHAERQWTFDLCSRSWRRLG